MSLPSQHMPSASKLWAHINVPSSPPAPPGTYIPEEIPPLTVPPNPGPRPEIIEPPTPEPVLPIREPGIVNPPQAGQRAWLH